MKNAIIKDANILGGEPVFRGTRVPFKILTDYLEGGDTLDQFLEQYPSVSRELAIARVRAKSAQGLSLKTWARKSYGPGSRLVRQREWRAPGSSRN